MRKPLGSQKCDGPTDRRTDGQTDLPTDTARCKVACPRLKKVNMCILEEEEGEEGEKEKEEEEEEEEEEREEIILRPLLVNCEFVSKCLFSSFCNMFSQQ